MKKIYLFIFGVIISVSSSAQLTQMLHAPMAGETYTMYQCDSTAINPGFAGSGAVWSFSSIATRSSVVLNYAAVTSTNTTYPNATVALSSGTIATAYYNSDASSLKYYGGNFNVGTTPVSLVYSSPAIQASYPMSLNSTSTNTIAGTLTAAGFPGTFTGNASVKADGTGTLMLPGGITFSNVMRVTTTQTINFVVTGGFATGTVTQVNYDYYSSGMKPSAFSISSSTVASSIAATTTQTFVFRYKAATTSTTSTVGMNDLKANVNVAVLYPNPCNASVNFKMNNSVDAKLTVYDLTGKLVEKTDINSDKLTLSTANYSNGVYIYKIQNLQGENIQTGKFTVTH